jgi:hypothetical protein
MAQKARLAILIAVLATACTAGRNETRPAQSIGRSSSGVKIGSWEKISTLHPGTPLVVTTKSGHRIDGRFGALDASTLTLTAVAGTSLSLERSAVSRIVTPPAKDSLSTGTLIGAGVGLGVAIAMLAVIGSDDGYLLPSAKVAAPLVLSGIGSVIGMSVDRSRKRPERLLYVAGTP